MTVDSPHSPLHSVQPSPRPEMKQMVVGGRLGWLVGYPENLPFPAGRRGGRGRRKEKKVGAMDAAARRWEISHTSCNNSCSSHSSQSSKSQICSLLPSPSVRSVVRWPRWPHRPNLPREAPFVRRSRAMGNNGTEADQLRSCAVITSPFYIPRWRSRSSAISAFLAL